MAIRILEPKKVLLSLFSLTAALLLQILLINMLYEACGSCNERDSDVLKTVKINLVSVSSEVASIQPEELFTEIAEPQILPKTLTEPPPEILLEKQPLPLPDMPPAILPDIAPQIVPDIPPKTTTEITPKTNTTKVVTQTITPSPTINKAAQPIAETPSNSETKTRNKVCTAVLTDESVKYLVKARNIIEKNKTYPIKARRKQIEGTVSLSFLINKNGRVSKLTVLESPDKSLTNASTKLLKSIKLPKPPTSWDETKTVKFEINYRLR